MKENLENQIKEILYRHRANDRGNKDLNLFEDKNELSKQDEYYAEQILSLIKSREERIREERKKTITRFKILLGRFKACDIIKVNTHEVSLKEIPAWIDDVLALLEEEDENNN